MKKKFDLVIIGAGPGGYVAAIQAAQQKKSVALIEKRALGGTCLNIGCIPTKTLIHHAQLLKKIENAKIFGIDISKFSFDYSKMKQRKDDVIKNLRNNLQSLLLANKIHLFQGSAFFVSSNEIAIEEEDLSLSFDHAIIATGSNPATLPDLAFDHRYIFHSASLLNLSSLPKSLIIIGGGYIGCEFASLYHQLGVKVTLIEKTETILPFQEKIISEKLTKTFQKRGIDIYTNASIKTIEKKEQLLLHLNHCTITADIVLVAVGRKAYIDGLHVEKIGLALTPKGSIIVNANMQTTIPHIYAIGDVSSRYMLAHVASHEGMVAVSHLCNNKIFPPSVVPFVIFTIPEIASVGITQKEAGQHNVETTIFPFSSLGKAYTNRQTEGFVQILYEKDTKQILGAHMMGENASIMIAEMALAINNELTLDCIVETIHAHPTLPEAWFEVASLANHHPIHILNI